MTDLISRHAAIEAIMKHTGMTPIAKLEAETTICRVPSAEPEQDYIEFKKGIKKSTQDDYLIYNRYWLYEHFDQEIDIQKSVMKSMGYEKAEPERKKGKWIQSKEFHGYDNEFNRDAIACSACHVAFPETEGYRIEDMLEDFRYCPNCGADMRGEE